MCFSAEASFIGGAVLVGIGTASVLKVSKPSQTLFAAIPFLFGFQQIAEGFLWMSIPNPESWLMKQISTRVFLFFSNILWPLFVPYSILLLEPNLIKRKTLLALTAVGAVVAVYYFSTILLEEVQPQIVGHHIKYGIKSLSGLQISILVLYVASTIPPFFISSHKNIRQFGILMAVSLAVSLVFFIQFLTSVWCFFAAIISVYIYWIITKMEKETYE